METVISIAKFAFAVLAIPMIFALTESFGHTIDKYSFFSYAFRTGILAYVIIHLFVFPLKVVYGVTQKVIELMFRFSTLLSKTVPLFVSLLTVGLLAVFWMAHAKNWRWEVVWPFFIGMAFAMHLICTADTLRQEDSAAVKPHYFFVMAWVYAFNLTLVVVFLSVTSGASVPDFFTAAFTKAKWIYWILFKYLF